MVSSDSNGDEIYYYIDWGDGTADDWFGPFPSESPVTATHTWPAGFKAGTIRVKAKDVNGDESGWGTLQYFVSRNKNINGRSINLFERFFKISV